MVSELMTTEETAHYLRLSIETVKRKARAGGLPAAKVGRVWRFRKAELDAWLGKGGGATPDALDDALALEAERRLTDPTRKRVPWDQAKAALGL